MIRKEWLDAERLKKVISLVFVAFFVQASCSGVFPCLEQKQRV